MTSLKHFFEYWHWPRWVETERLGPKIIRKKCTKCPDENLYKYKTFVYY